MVDDEIATDEETHQQFRKEWRRTHFDSRSLGILITLFGCISLLSTSSIAVVRLGLTRLITGIAGTDHAKIKVAQQYSNTTSVGAGRIFRKNNGKGHMPFSGSPQYQHRSTFERLWPGYTLPWWAHKAGRLAHFHPPTGHEICFVHVGKAGGSSIGCALGFRLHCEDKQNMPGRLAKSATHIFHKDVYDCPDTTDYYLFVVRDPLDRTRSAFVYGRPDEYGRTNEPKYWQAIEQLYLNCFSTLSSLASLGLADNGGASDECKQRARDMLRGKVRYEDHIYFNYQYYLEAIPPKSKILVIRTEHLEEDWNNIERGLGGRPRTNIEFPHDNTKTHKETRDLILGSKERLFLCHELCVEIQTYKLMLKYALNLGAEQYNVTMTELEAKCPKEALLKQCDFHTPNIQTKLLQSRGYPR